MQALVKAYRLRALTSALAAVLAGTAGQVAAQGVPQRTTTPGGAQRPSGSLPPVSHTATHAPLSQAPVSQAPVSRPVVQPLPGGDGMTLNEALGRLGRDPRDTGALIDAGNAALAMGDVDAATGFFRRADQVSPGNPRVKAGLAGAMVRSGDPFSAIPLFDEAEKAGALDSALAVDRGLAYDLVGDSATAQRYYRQSLARMPSEEATRRLALSYAISGDKQNSEMILAPLLQHRSLAAGRTRAFALAILGQTEEAVTLANSILPSELAAGVAPYLRYMPRLTRAQQAAAANFGAFPRPSEIGRDDPRVAQYAPQRTADVALAPRGDALGRKSRSRDRNRTARTPTTARVATALPAAVPVVAAAVPVARVAPPELPQPARQTSVAAAPLRTAAVSSPAPMATELPALTSPPPAAAPQIARTETPALASTPARPVAMAGVLPVAPGFTITPTASSAAVVTSPPPVAPAAPSVTQLAVATPAPRPTATPAPSPAAPAPRRLADVFADFGRPSIDVSPAAGAVDLRRIKPTRPEVKKPVEPPKPPPPSHPSRIWVQVATGRDKGALGFDWRRMAREKADTLRGKAAFISAWGQTNRLLTGPFQSESAANTFIGQLRRADVDGAFVWTSPAGQVVDALPAVAASRR